MVGGKGARFNVNIDELRQFNPRLANFVVKSPIDAIKMFENQLNGTIKGMNDVDGGKGGLNNEINSRKQRKSMKSGLLGPFCFTLLTE